MTSQHFTPDQIIQLVTALTAFIAAIGGAIAAFKSGAAAKATALPNGQTVVDLAAAIHNQTATTRTRAGDTAVTITPPAGAPAPTIEKGTP